MLASPAASDGSFEANDALVPKSIGKRITNSLPLPMPALCAETDPEAFFPEKGGSARPAKAVCRDCPVRAECLQYALDHHEYWGIWGGLSYQERRRLRQEAA